jgi:hypothetical protein
MNTTISDANAIRAIVISQACVMAALVVVSITVLITQERPRPGRLVGLIATGASVVLLLQFVAVQLINNFGKPLLEQTVIALIAVYLGSFGFSLLIAHVLFHSPALMWKIEKWFKDKRGG